MPQPLANHDFAHTEQRTGQYAAAGVSGRIAKAKSSSLTGVSAKRPFSIHRVTVHQKAERKTPRTDLAPSPEVALLKNGRKAAFTSDSVSPCHRSPVHAPAQFPCRCRNVLSPADESLRIFRTGLRTDWRSVIGRRFWRWRWLGWRISRTVRIGWTGGLGRRGLRGRLFA